MGPRLLLLLRHFIGTVPRTSARTGESAGRRPPISGSSLPPVSVEEVLASLRRALGLMPSALGPATHMAHMVEANPMGSESSGLSAIPGTDGRIGGHPQWSDERDAVLPLVEKSRRGDKDAFGQLYRRYHSRVYGLARFYLGEGAEDAVAETFMRAWAALPRYKPTAAPFVAWLYGIARHVVSDEFKRRKRTEPRDQLPDGAVDPRHDERLELAAAIAQLPTQQRQIVEMKYLLGLRNPEVAKALNKSIGAVNAQQWRALQSLKQMLEQE
jgi:RNA polymerase sigma-70 factor, ECF subfamily